MKRLKRTKATALEFDRNAMPVLTVSPGEEFLVETEDALFNRIRSDKDLPVETLVGDLFSAEPARTNPVAGPIFVRGAEKGDVLVVEVLDIIPAVIGFTSIVPGVGPLKDSYRWRELRGPFTKIIKHLPGKSGTTSDGTAFVSKKISWMLRPHIGTIGVAPEREVVASLTTQGRWGGNIDVRDVARGNKLLLPVYAKGGLLFLGDVHASQADTEFYGVADETRAEVRLRCHVLKKKRIPFPRVETRDSIIQLNCSVPLEDAVSQAMLWLIEMMVDDYHIDPHDAYLHTSINPDLRVHVYQMVKIGALRYTVGVEIPKRYLIR
ncbi:MAG: acetamidase/formamidase family protein [Thaumarchaeota archaeon]|nr:acetamidase/formamidase family protein [Nitrososphaerota archaeon]